MGISGRVCCLETGRIIAEGSSVELREDPKVIASYLGTDERAIVRSGETGSPASTLVAHAASAAMTDAPAAVPEATPHAPAGSTRMPGAARPRLGARA
jgi:Branched-chain amino acid ATP-binding cassette transporter